MKLSGIALSLLVAACSPPTAPQDADADRPELDAGTHDSHPASSARPTARVWPRRIVGVAPTTVLRATRWSGIVEATFHPISGEPWNALIVARGVDEDGQLWEAYARVAGREVAPPGVWVEELFSRVDVPPDAPRLRDREASFDRCRAEDGICRDRCAEMGPPRRDWCEESCASAAVRCLSVPDLVFEDDTISMTLESQSWPTSRGSRLRLRWAGAERVLYADEHPWLAIDELERVSVARSRTALVIRREHELPHVVLVLRGGQIRDLAGLVLHDYRRALPDERLDPTGADIVHSVAGPELQFPGDGTIRRPFRERQYCGASALDDNESSYERARYRRGEVVLRLDASASTIRFVERALGSWGPCHDEHVAACPFVDIVTAGGIEQVGEILRNVRYRPAQDALPLSARGDGALRIWLREDKDEVTHLDEIHVEVDGIAVTPLACRTASPPAYCVPDGRSFLLHRGERLELDFGSVPGQRVALVATGFYVPLDASSADPQDRRTEHHAR